MNCMLVFYGEKTSKSVECVESLGNNRLDVKSVTGLEKKLSWQIKVTHDTIFGKVT